MRVLRTLSSFRGLALVVWGLVLALSSFAFADSVVPFASATGQVGGGFEPLAVNRYFVAVNCISNASVFASGDVVDLNIFFCNRSGNFSGNCVAELAEQVSWQVPCAHSYFFDEFSDNETEVRVMLKRAEVPFWQFNSTMGFGRGLPALAGDSLFGANSSIFALPSARPPIDFWGSWTVWLGLLLLFFGFAGMRAYTALGVFCFAIGCALLLFSAFPDLRFGL